MLKFLFLVYFLFLSACSHVSIVQLGEGERSNTTIESCVHNVLAFPLNAEDGSADRLLSKYSLSPKEIYSVDIISWYYLFPLYFNYCHRARLNTQGEAQYLKISQQKGFSVAPAKKAGAADEFDGLSNVKDCEQFRSLKRDRCVEHFNEKVSK